MHKLIFTLALFSGLSLYPSANPAERDEKDTSHQLMVLRARNASAAAANSAPTEFDSKLRHTSKMPFLEYPEQVAAIREALDPVYGRGMATDISPIISLYAGPKPPSFAQKAQQLYAATLTALSVTNDRSYLNRLSDWWGTRFGATLNNLAGRRQLRLALVLGVCFGGRIIVWINQLSTRGCECSEHIDPNGTCTAAPNASDFFMRGNRICFLPIG